MMKDEKKVDFTIISRPDHIHLECPFCNEEIEVDWNDVDVPECWSDDWGYIECPECEKEIKLGEYDYD